MHFDTPNLQLPQRASGRLRVGLDVVQISRIVDSIEHFGDHFRHRLYTSAERQYAASSPNQEAERLAARFAAKEAAIKAFSLSDVGVDWRDIEVCRHDDGACELHLHGHAAQHARKLGVTDIAISLSHDGDYASAIVTALCDSPP